MTKLEQRQNQQKLENRNEKKNKSMDIPSDTLAKFHKRRPETWLDSV